MYNMRTAAPLYNELKTDSMTYPAGAPPAYGASTQPHPLPQSFTSAAKRVNDRHSGVPPERNSGLFSIHL
jgi:hypothetical protein